jgi:ABC-2 type transport system ATP-binding protein
MEPIIELKNLKKTFKVLNRHEGLKGSIRDLFSRDYKYVNAVDDISANIYPGEIVGYLGPNGAGKSTTIKMMTGILEPSDGVIVVNGLIPYKNRALNAQNIGVVFGQRTQLWWALPVIESFKILKEIYSIDTKTYNENLELFDSIVNISSLYMKPVRQMSLGQRTLCDIVASFLHDPKIVFLDEPTIGLDVSMKSKIREIIKKINEVKGTTIILTTHDIGDIEALCKRAVIIDKGKMVYDNDFSQLKNKFGKYRTLKLEKSSHSEINDRIYAVVKQINDICDAITVVEQENEAEAEWIELLINEDIITLTDVLNKCLTAAKVNDVKIEEIRAEDIIKKIYEGDGNEN